MRNFWGGGYDNGHHTIRRYPWLASCAGIVQGYLSAYQNEKFSRDLELLRQSRDAATSVMANIAEGFDSQSTSEFIRFLYYALRSASELQSHFYVALDQTYVTEPQFAELYEQAKEDQEYDLPVYRLPADFGCSTSNAEHRTSNI
jgi:four helix bundle protein